MSDFKTTSFRHAHKRTTRRDLLKLLTGTVTAAAAAPQLLNAAPAKAQPRPLGLKDSSQAIVDWDVSTDLIHGSGCFYGGRVAYATAANVVVKDIQRGETIYSAPTSAIGTPQIIDNRIYSNRLLELVAFDLTKPPGRTPAWTRGISMDSGVLAVGRRLLFSEFRGTCNVVLYDPASDTVIWSCNTTRTDKLAQQPVIAGSRILVRLTSAIVCIDFETGALLWTIPANEADGVSGEQPGLDADESYLYFTERPVGSGSFLHAADLQTGAIAWTWSNGTWMGPPVVSQGKVYVGDQNGALHAFVAGPGQNRTPVSAFPAVQLAPDLHTHRMFTEDGVLYAFSGRAAWAVDLASEGQRSISWGDGTRVFPVGVENGVVYVGHANGAKLAAVDMADQLHQFSCESQLWRTTTSKRRMVPFNLPPPGSAHK